MAIVAAVAIAATAETTGRDCCVRIHVLVADVLCWYVDTWNWVGMIYMNAKSCPFLSKLLLSAP